MHVDVIVEPNPNSGGEDVMRRWEARSAPRPVTRVRWARDAGEALECRVTGWGPGGACEAAGVDVEDSGAGTAVLVTGGDWGVRLSRSDSRAPWSLDDPA